MALITAAEARLVIDSLTGTSEDTNLDTLISAAGGLAAAWCRYMPASVGVAPTLESTSYTFYLDGPDPLQGRRLLLPVRPVTAVASVHDAQSGTWDYGSADLVASTEYTILGDEGAIWLNPDATHSWGSGSRNLRVILTGGFVTIPDPIKQAARSIVKWMWDKRRSESLQQVSTDGYSVQQVPVNRIPAQARQLLAPYRLPGAYIG